MNWRDNKTINRRTVINDEIDNFDCFFETNKIGEGVMPPICVDFSTGEEYYPVTLLGRNGNSQNEWEVLLPDGRVWGRQRLDMIKNGIILNPYNYRNFDDADETISTISSTDLNECRKLIGKKLRQEMGNVVTVLNVWPQPPLSFLSSEICAEVTFLDGYRKVATVKELLDKSISHPFLARDKEFKIDEMRLGQKQFSLTDGRVFYNIKLLNKSDIRDADAIIILYSLFARRNYHANFAWNKKISKIGHLSGPSKTAAELFNKDMNVIQTCEYPDCMTLIKDFYKKKIDAIIVPDAKYFDPVYCPWVLESWILKAAMIENLDDQLYPGEYDGYVTIDNVDFYLVNNLFLSDKTARKVRADNIVKDATNSYMTYVKEISCRSSSLTIKSSERDAFEEMVAQAKEYYEKHGDLLVSRRSGALGRFIHRMRSKYKEGKLSSWQIEMLEDVGMAWKVSRSKE